MQSIASNSDEIHNKTAFDTNAEDSLEDWLDPIAKSENDAALEADWTPEEERLLIRRLDFYLIPVVMIMFFTLNLDR